jgi:hypothetical protein
MGKGSSKRGWHAKFGDGVAAGGGSVLIEAALLTATV